MLMIGTFHAMCTYLKMVGKKMEGTGKWIFFNEKLHGRKLITVCEGHAYLLTSEYENILSHEIESLCSIQEDIDTSVILYCFYRKQEGYGRHNDMVDRFGIPVTEMPTDMFHLS